MPLFPDLFSFIFMSLPAISGAAGARLQKGGELQRLAVSHPGRFKLTIVIGIANLAALFYFSWALFRWPHWLAFAIVSLIVTPLLARTQHRGLLWLSFALPGTLLLACELLLLGLRLR